MDTWCRIDETLGWIIEILFSFPSDMYDILKQVKRYSVQSSEGGNKETGEKKVNKSKNKDFLCGITALWVHKQKAPLCEEKGTASL